MAPATAAHPEETDLILAWLEKPGVRLVAVDVPWACPVRSAESLGDATTAVATSVRPRLATADDGRVVKLVPASDGSAGERELDITEARPVTLDPRRHAGHPDQRSPAAHGMMASMLTAIVLIDSDAARIPEVAAAIADLPGVSEVYSVTGEVDLIAMVRVREHDDLADVIADKVSKIEGVLRTQTYIAFRTYSQHDLEQAFALGLED